MITAVWRLLGAAIFFFVVALSACGNDPVDSGGAPTTPAVESFMKSLSEACPVGNLESKAERDACAWALPARVAGVQNPRRQIVWGGQKEGAGLLPYDIGHVTEFDSARVFPMLYLSTFAFESRYTCTREVNPNDGIEYEVCQVPSRFRELDPGEYAYPFWHAPGKIKSYTQARKIIFYFQAGVWVAALRSNDLDPNRIVTPREDRGWEWEEDGERQPRVTSFTYVFSPGNEYVAELNTAYQALALAERDRNCMSCHEPDNKGAMPKLELLRYPVQALSGRKDLIRILEDNTMPPAVGIGDSEALDRMKALALEFNRVADKAYAWEDGVGRGGD